MLGAVFLAKRGLGPRRYVVAGLVNSLLFIGRQRTTQIDRDFNLILNHEFEEEMELMLVRYLKPYFELSGDE